MCRNQKALCTSARVASQRPPSHVSFYTPVKAFPLDTCSGADGWVRGSPCSSFDWNYQMAPQNSCSSGRTREHPRQYLPCPLEDALLQNRGQTKKEEDVGPRKQGSQRGKRGKESQAEAEGCEAAGGGVPGSSWVIRRRVSKIPFGI